MSVAASSIHRLNVCLIPSPYNDHRPLALRHRPLFAVSALLIGLKVFALIALATVPATAELSTITAERIVQLTNAERKKRGLEPLQVNSALTRAAEQKGRHMLEEDYFAHISPSGVTPWFWMSKAGYHYTIAGENLAIDFTEAEDAVAAWLASPTHRDNMLLPDYRETGVAAVQGEFQGGTSIIVVHMFGTPTAVTATPTSSPLPPSPSASPAEQPSPSVVPVPADTTPPRTPRIALAQEGNMVTGAVTVIVEGDPTSTITLRIAGKTESFVLVHATETRTIELTDMSDGPITLLAFATDTAHNRSDTSEPVTVVKNTIGPALAASDVSFMISPATDRNLLAARLTSRAYPAAELISAESAVSLGKLAWSALPATNGTFTLRATTEDGRKNEVSEVAVTPSFAVDEPTNSFASPAPVWRLSKYLAGVFFSIILILLTLAILIRIRIQHIGLISHATAVLVLAAILFFI